jgi:hypothetical protein
MPLLAGCIVFYDVSPKVDSGSPRPSEKRVPLYYRLDPHALLEKVRFEQSIRQPHPALDPSLSTYGDFEELRSAFVQDRGAEMIEAQTPPQHGVFCSVDVTSKPHSSEAGFFQMLTVGSIGFIPSYSGESGYIVRYDLYVDGDLKKRYVYVITRQLTAWLGLLPFIWVNALTPSDGEALASTVGGFFRDVKRDGFL